MSTRFHRRAGQARPDVLVGIALAFAGTVGCGGPSTLDAETRASVDELRRVTGARADSLMRAHGFPSFTVAVVHAGEVAFVDSWGLADRATARPATPRSLYQVGSVTKTFTGLLLAALVSEGTVRLGDPVADYLPSDVVVPTDSLGGTITVQHLATHTSGLPRYPPNLDRIDGDPILGFDADELYEGIASSALEHSIGGAYLYSNFGYGVLGHALSRATGRTLEGAVREYVLDPMGMHDTGFTLSTEQRDRLATPYRDDDPTVETAPWEMGALEGAGGLFSTGEDLARFMIAAMSPGEGLPHELREALVLVDAPLYRFTRTTNWAYGLGRFVVDDPEVRRIITHGGDVDGYAAYFAYAPGRDVGVAFLTNSGMGQPLGGFGDWLLEQAVERLAGEPSTDAPTARMDGEGTSGADELSEPEHEVVTRIGVSVPMRDGVNLAADVLVPDAEGRFPTILVRTPYGRGAAIGAWAGEALAQRGYAFVAQDMRGKGESGGRYDLPWAREGEDGFDTIEWIARQSWSDGSVGMLGGSALGQAAWAAAAEAPPGLAALLVFPSIGDPFFGGAYDSGVPSLPPFWAYENSLAEPRELPEFDWADLEMLPLSRVDEATFGETVAIWDRYLELDEQSEWPTLAWPDGLDRVEVPVLHLMALWDGDGIGPVLNWSAMRDRDDQWLVFGPWDHGMGMPAGRGDVEYGPESRVSLLTPIVRWFDTWLKRKNVGQADEPKSRVFVTGCNTWTGLTDWPPPDAPERVLYLGPADAGRVGSLSSTRPTSGTSSYRYDPHSPRVMTFEESVFSETTVLPFPAPASDALLFLSEPLEEAMVIGAPIELDLSFSTEGRDADVFALLVEVSPEGEMRALTHPGKLRLGFRNGWGVHEPLEPGRVYGVTVRLWDVAHRFEAGGRLGLVVRSDWLPRWARNLNTAEPIAHATAGIAATHTVLHGADHLSRLRFRELPVECGVGVEGGGTLE